RDVQQRRNHDGVAARAQGGRGARAVSLGAGHQEPHADTRWLWCMSGAADSVGPLPRVRGRGREGACNKARAEGRCPGEEPARVCRTVITSPRFKPHIASPFVPAKAGTQSFLDSRFRGNERSLDAKLRFNVPPSPHTAAKKSAPAESLSS